MSFLSRHGATVWPIALCGVAGIGIVDFVSGAELRVYPLYFGPVSLVAWHRGRFGAIIIAIYSAACWFVSNYLAGMQFSHPGLWIANTATHGASFAFVAVLIARLREAVARERALSRTDPLTALLNTRAFYTEAMRVLATARRTGRPVTIAYLDLDNFKTVNDRAGHKAGDDLLRAVATAMAGAVRPSDLLARVGGDEFALLLPETGIDGASPTLERLLTTVTAAVAGQHAVTCSIGAVSFTRPPEDIEVMVQLADARMYDAKVAGKSRVVLRAAS